MKGERLGPYQLLGELGSGGMGKVFKAEVIGPVSGLESGCVVALKVIHAHLLETPGFFKRFLREAEIGRTIQHENVVRTYDCDALVVDQVQQNFLVMEYVEGQTLRDLLQELERIPEELCRHIGREVARGLQAIHEAGVLHRDLKPENVLITSEHKVKVMDLGVARLEDEATRLSQAGAFVGSLEYAAPEQFRAREEEPDGRADLHALGVLLYELASGEHPYRDEDPAKLIRNILDTVPRRVGDVNPQLSPFFEEVVHRLIAKDRDERFPSAAGLGQVLEEGEASPWWMARAQALRAETKRPLRRVRIPRETALYGRDEDLNRLHALYGRARDGEGQVLLLEGEAGIGKTRLVDEFVGRLRQEGQDVNFLFGSYPPGGAATAAGAFSTAYREHFGSEGLGTTLKSYLASTPILIPAFAALLRGEMTPSGAEPLTKDSLQTVFVHATRSLAAERPTIVLVDDLHFAPEDGRALFTSLAMALTDHAVLLIGTMRPGVPGGWTADVARLDHAEHRTLSRLGPKDLGRLLIDAFRSERLAAELGLQIATKSDGNPFFAFEIIRGLREGQFIAQKPDGTWATTRVIQDIQVPSSVLDLVQARIGDLEEEEKNLLDVASCCGFAFDPLLAAQVLGVAEIPALQRLARIEARCRLVRSAGQHFTFDHHQVQEALYDGLPELLRARYHTAIGNALESRAREKVVERTGALEVDLCRHFLRGSESHRAGPHLDAALDYLADGFLNDQAIRLADEALDTPGMLTGAARCRVLLKKSERLDILGRIHENEATLKEARSLADAAGDHGLAARAANAAGRVMGQVGRYEDAQRHYERALALAREAGDPSAELTALAALGNVFHSTGRHEEARARREHVLAMARELGDARREASAILNLGTCDHIHGRFPEARALYEQALEKAVASGNRPCEAVAIGNLGRLHQLAGRSDAARQCFERGLAIARETGDRKNEANATEALGVLHQFLGSTEKAMEAFEHYLQIARETGNRRGEAVAAGSLGNAFSRLGQTEVAVEMFEEQLAIGEEIGDPATIAAARGNCGVMSLALGNHEEARVEVERALELYCELGNRHDEAMAHTALGEIAATAGDEDVARAHYDEAVSIGRALNLPATIVLAGCGLATLSGGDAREAAAGLAKHEDTLPCAARLAAHAYLWKGGRDPAHLAEARRLLDHLVDHAPEIYRGAMQTNVPLHREIMEACASMDSGSADSERM